MPKIRLNDAGLRRLNPPAKGQTDFWDSGLAGFGCRVSQGGTKTFLLKHANRRITIGKYPIISLQDARSEAKRLLAEFTLGRLHPQSLAYSEAVRLFLEDRAKSARPRTVADYKRHLAKHFSFKGQLAHVTHAQVAHRLAGLKHVPAEHNHARTVATIFFNWCMKRRYITQNPALGISPYERKRRSRVLSDTELQSIWRACEQTGEDATTSGALESSTRGASEGLARFATDNQHFQAPRLPAHFATIVQLLILCGQREGETAALQKSWIDLENKTITIPASVAKNGNEHCFPMGALSAAILARLSTTILPTYGHTSSSGTSTTYFFPAKGKPNKPFCGFGKAKIALDKLSGITGWTLHDIRRTFRSNLGRIGVAPHIAERLVNHISARTDMERTYDIYSYLPEMRAAIHTWETYLQTRIINSDGALRSAPPCTMPHEAAA